MSATATLVGVPAASPVGTCEIVGGSWGGRDISQLLRDRYAAFKAVPANSASNFSFTASNSVFGFDPNVGVGKACVIFYRVVLRAPGTSQPVWSVMQAATAPESQTITVVQNGVMDFAGPEPDPSTNQYIVSARYFTVDVTAAVQLNYALAHHPGQGTDLIASPGALHVDPYHFSPKNLTVAYGNYSSPGRWEYSVAAGLGPAASWTLNIPAPFPVASSQPSSYSTSFVTFTNGGPVSPGYDVYPRVYDNDGFLIWDGQRHGFVLPSGTSRDLHLCSRIGVPVDTQCYFGFAYVQGGNVVNSAYDTTFYAIASQPGSGSPATITWNGPTGAPIVSHTFSKIGSPIRPMSYGPRDLRIILRGASWGSANFTEFMKETYITSTIYNPPSDASNSFSFQPSAATLGSDPNPGVPKVFVLIYQVGYKVGEMTGTIRNSGIATQGAVDLSQYGSPGGTAVVAPAAGAVGPGLVGPSTEQTDSYPIIDDIGSQYFYVQAKEGATINVNLLSLNTTPVLMTNSISKSGAQQTTPEIFMAIWSSVDVTAKVKSQLSIQPPTSTTYANVTIGPALGPNPMPLQPKQLTMVYGYPTGDWRYTYRTKVIMHADFPIALPWFHAPNTWIFPIERSLPDPQPELPAPVTPTAYLQYDTELMTNYVPGTPSQNLPTSTEVQSYTLNVRLFDSASFALASGSVYIQSSTSANVSLNGQAVSLNVTPVRYALDSSGEICIIAPSNGMMTPTYTFSNLKDVKGNVIALPPTTVDPSKKVLSQFSGVQTASDLKNMPGRSGQTLYSGVSPPADSDLNAAAQTFKDLSSASATMPVTPSAVLAALTTVALKPLPNDGWPAAQTNKATSVTAEAIRAPTITNRHVQEKFSFPSIPNPAHIIGDIGNSASSAAGAVGGAASSAAGAVTGAASSAAGAISGAANSASGAITGAISSASSTASSDFGKVKSGVEGTVQQATNGISRTVMKATDVAGWVINEAKTVWAYVVKFANQAWTFVIDTVEDIGHAFDTVWSAIKLGWNELVMWAGFLFDWKGIIATQKTIHSFLEAAVSSWSTELKNNNFNLDGLINALTDAKASHPAPPDVLVSAGRTNAQDNTSPMGKILQSTPVKWLGHHIKHGGMLSDSSTNVAAGSKPPASGDTLTNEIGAMVNSISSKMTELVQAIGGKFDVSSLLSFGDLVGSIADEVLSEFIDAVVRIIRGYLAIMGDVVDLFDRLGNTKVDIPILTDLYRLITGEDLTMSNAVTLMVAIPASVITRLATQAPFPSIDVSSLTSADFIGIDGNSSSHASAPAVSASSVTNRTSLAAGVSKTEMKTLAGPPATIHKLDTVADPPPSITALDTAGAAGLMGVALLEVVLAVGDVMDQNQSLDDRPPLTPNVTKKKMVGCIVKLLGYILALPYRNFTVPGRTLRIIMGVDKGWLAFQTFCFLFYDTGAIDDPAFGIMKFLDILNGTVNFVLGSIIIHDELTDTAWRDYSRTRSGLQCGSNVLNFLAQVGDYSAYESKQSGSDPEVTLALLAGRAMCLEARWGLLAIRFFNALTEKENASLW